MCVLWFVHAVICKCHGCFKLACTIFIFKVIIIYSYLAVYIILDSHLFIPSAATWCISVGVDKSTPQPLL